jgi:hypothetical protein
VSTNVGQGVSETVALGETEAVGATVGVGEAPAVARDGIGGNVCDGTGAVVEAAR